MISDEYRAVLADTHARFPRWGTSARGHVENVAGLIRSIDARHVLDYGCGKGELGKCLAELDLGKVHLEEYDPGIPGLDDLAPGAFDLVVCLDVMEHVEPDHLQDVMQDLKQRVGKIGFFVISTRPASGMLSDGRNAHLIVKSAAWWGDVFKSHFKRTRLAVSRSRHEAYLIVAADDYDGEIHAIEPQKTRLWV